MSTYSATQEARMSNTSRIDVFSASNETESRPEFWKNVPPVAMVATMGPGDMLYIPPGWWHAMRSESESFSVSIWF
jgi:ribosomal protein L16 Arg81 hydroxylase